jgi:hypothetical protein
VPNEYSMEQVEELASEFSQGYFTAQNTPQSTPVPIEDMAEHYLGYSIDVTDEGLFSDPNVLGGIDFDQKTILVNSSVEDHDGRYAFTVAHEIGHHVLHKEAYESSVAQEDKSILCRDTFEKPQIELEADRFAAALLMPASVIQDAYDQCKPKRHIETIGQARGVAFSVTKEAMVSNVSNTAMLNRLIDLSLIPKEVGYQDGVHSIGVSRGPLATVWRGVRYRLRKALGL